MKSNPTVTFIMPAYNAGKFIGAAIESVLAQTFTDFELIVINDGSSDNTMEEASSYATKDPRIRLLEMGSPSGSAYQPRKKGILAANSNLISPLDADDWIEPDYLEKLMEMKNATGANMVYPTMWKEQHGIKSVITPTDTSLLGKAFRGADCLKYTLDGWRINCNGGVIDREVYLETFREFDSSIAYSCADELLTRQLLLTGRSVAFSPARYFYRDNEDSITRKPTAKMFDFLTNNIALTEMTARYFDSHSEECIRAARQNFHGIFDAARILNRHDFDKETRRYALKQIDKAKRIINPERIKKHVSPRYFMLLSIAGTRLPAFLKVADLIFRNK